jgi:hypothetical protein
VGELIRSRIEFLVRELVLAARQGQSLRKSLGMSLEDFMSKRLTHARRLLADQYH